MELLQMENIIATQLRVRVPKLLDNEYKHMSFTTEMSEKQPVFPNVYIHELEPSEVGNSLPNQQIHAIRDTLQIEVRTNTSKTDARKVINACISAMKTLQFSMVAMPIHTKENNVHRFIIRVRRVIASGDTFK